VRESSVTDRLVSLLTERLFGCVVFKHFDQSTAGIPDVSVTWARKTCWLELKYANPSYEIRKAQEVTMRRLGVAGLAFFVIFRAHPKEVVVLRDHPEGPINQWAFKTSGHDYAALVEFIRGEMLA
jgi:hypothetical protein